jgi:hypothetical protein
MEGYQMSRIFPRGVLKAGDGKTARRLRRTVALAATVTLLSQNFAWAVCSNGQTMPAGGFVIGRDAVVSTAANWSPNIFTGTAGSIFVPDTSTNEHNNVAEPATGGGHNWVFDQGSTLCKVTDTGTDPATGRSASWNIPPNTPTDCVILPIIKNGQVTNLGDIPYQGQTVTPTCDPSILATPTNTYFNQLGCSVSAVNNLGTPVATTPQTATTFMFVAGIKGGLFSIPLNNVVPATPGGTAGKTVGPQNYYSDIPEGQKLTNAAVSPDGMFAVVTSIRRAQFVYACLNPLGDPGDPTQPITFATLTTFANSAITSQVKCMQAGSNNLAVDLTTAFGPDNQPYFGGQRIVNSFNGQPGGTTSTAWPQCLFLGATGLPGTLQGNLKAVFNAHSANRCGSAQPNFGFSSALVTQPQAIIGHTNVRGDKYLYTGPLGGTIVQFKLTVNPFSGITQYTFRTVLTGISLNTGLGIADDLTYSGGNGDGSLMIFSDPSAVGLAGQETVTRLPLCEDM